MTRRWLLVPALLLSLLMADFTALSPTADAQIPTQRGARLQNAAVATGNGSTLDTSQMSVVTFQSSGTFVGTVTLEGSNDGTNFNSLTCYPLDSSSGTSTMTTATIVRCNVLGIPVVRARVSAWTSGSITVVAQATSAQANVRDSAVTISNPFTGQLRGTQTTIPTVGLVNGGGSMQSSTAEVIGAVGADSVIRVKVREGLTAAQASPNLMVTFNTAWSAIPACTAALENFTRAYNYYLYAVTPTTTTLTLALTGGVGIASSAVNAWPPHSSVAVHCVGVQ